MSTGDSVRERRGESRVPEDVANVLVCSGPREEDARRAYYEQLLPAPPATLSVLGVTYTRGPDAWLDEWREYAGDVPADCALVSVADGMRSATASDGPNPMPGLVHSVESPQDLTGLGITLGQQLSQWADDAPVVSFDSLTALLQYVDTRRAFRFLHVLTNRTRRMDGVGHYHVDPDAHDDQTLATLSSLFDARATFGDGEWTVQTRE